MKSFSFLLIINKTSYKLTMILNRYDPKRSCYVPHADEKFCEGLIQETVGGKVKVQLLDGENKEFKQELVTQVYHSPHFGIY